MLEELIKDSEIQDFLSMFPKDQWNKCVYISLIYGIRQIRQEFSYPRLNSLESLINNRAKPSKPEKRGKIIESPTVRTPKFDRPNTSLPIEYKEKHLQPSKRFSSPPSMINNDKKQRTMPKYLKNVQSKIKDEIKKDVAMHIYKKEVLNSPNFKRKFNKSLPDLQEVQEPNICTIEDYKQKVKDLGIAKIAENFLNNPYTRVLSPL